MEYDGRLKGKKILIVDDEPDVLATLEEILDMCDLVKSTNFEDSKRLVETESYDIVILDIMGVDGYRLLNIANKRKLTAVMLTAHALDPENAAKSFNEGASFYVPKDKIGSIASYLEDVLEAKESGKSTWWSWLERIGNNYFVDRFGPNWKDQDKEFWKKLDYH